MENIAKSRKKPDVVATNADQVSKSKSTEEKQQIKIDQSNQAQEENQQNNTPDYIGGADALTIISPELKEMLDEIAALNKEKDRRSDRIRQLDNLLKPVPRLNGKIRSKQNNVLRLTPTERKAYKIEREDNKHQKELLQRKINNVNGEFSELYEKEMENKKKARFYDKANDLDYVRQNKRFIKGRLEKTIQDAAVRHKEELLRIKKLAAPSGKVQINNFNSNLSDFLDLHYKDVKILCSGFTDVRDELFDSAREALSEWKPSSGKKGLQFEE